MSLLSFRFIIFGAWSIYFSNYYNKKHRCPGYFSVNGIGPNLACLSDCSFHTFN